MVRVWGGIFIVMVRAFLNLLILVVVGISGLSLVIVIMLNCYNVYIKSCTVLN